MATTRKAERRILTGDEFELVQNTHHPALGQMDKQELDQTIKLLRERRDRARAVVNRQRRDLRTQGHGRTTFAEEERGIRRRKAILREALVRANKEQSRRNANVNLRASVRKALEMKKEASSSTAPSSGRTSNEGMPRKESAKRQQIGNPMDAGRISQQGKTAQAKRDNR